MSSQEHFEEIIRGGKAIKGKKCNINTPLNGDIDFSPLKNLNLDEIYFVDGNISHFHNIPRGIKKIVINNNNLESIPELELRDLVHLEAKNNKLTKVNLKEMVNLISLYLNNNKIRRIDNIPDSLSTLYADQNELEELDLNKCTNASCLNNLMLNQVIGDISNPKFNIMKDPHTRIMLMGGAPKRKKEDVLYPDVKQAVNAYYELKLKYTESRKNIINSIMAKSGTRKGKIQEIRNAKFKCINCNREGGTIFEKNNAILIAMCGNKTNPCNLNIKILASLNLTESEILENKTKLNEAKQEIVKIKMNTLFNYTKEELSIKQFEKNLAIINDTMVLTNDYSYYEIQNDSKKESIISKKMKFVYSELAEIRIIMEEYQIDGNKKLLSTVALKHKGIKDALYIVRCLKYPIHEMVKESTYNFVDDDGNFIDKSKASKIDLNVLKQYPYSFDDVFNQHLDSLTVEKYTTL